MYISGTIVDRVGGLVKVAPQQRAERRHRFD
jgi:hypothetical protein